MASAKKTPRRKRLARNPRGFVAPMSDSNLLKLLSGRLLEGKRVAIAGSSDGIGFACGYTALLAGAEVVFNSHEPKMTEAQKKKLTATGGTWHFVVADISSRNGPKNFVNKAWKLMDGIDILLNNVGIWMPYDPKAEFDHDMFDRMLRTNVRGAMNASKRFIQLVLDNTSAEERRMNPPKIFNTSSINARVSEYGHEWYEMTKGAIESMTQSFATSNLKNSILFFSMAPGLVTTELIKSQLSQRQMNAKAKRTPLGRLSEPNEVGSAFLGYASDLFRFTTGVSFRANDGAIGLM